MPYFPDILRMLLTAPVGSNPIGNDLPQNGGITGTLPPVYPGVNPAMNPMPDMSMPEVYPGTIPPFGGDRINQLFQPEHAASDRVNELLGSMPQRNNPGFWRKLGASFVGLGRGGIDAADKALYAPYYNQLEDWETQFKPAYQAANLERYSNATERQAAQTQMYYDTNTRKIDETTRHNQATEQDRYERTEIARSRAAAYNWKAMHPNFKFEVDGDGYLRGIDPQSGLAHYVTGPDGKPVESSKLPEETKYELLHGYRMKEINRRGQIATGLEETRQGNRLELEGARQTSREKLLARRQAARSAAGKPTSEYQIKQGRVNRAQALIGEMPEYTENIKILPGGIVIVEPEGLDDMEYEMLIDEVFNEPAKDINLPDTSTPSPYDSPNPQTAPPMTPGGPKIPQPPPPQQRTDGMPWTLPNGKRVVWSKQHNGWIDAPGGK